MGSFSCPDCVAVARIDGVTLNLDPRWCAYDLAELITEAEERVNNRIKPYAQGRLGFRQRFDQTLYQLDIAFNGLYDAGGFELGYDEGADKRCMEAVLEFQAVVCADPGNSDSTRTLELQLLDSDVLLTGPVQVRDLRRASGPVDGIWDGTLPVNLIRPWEIT